MHIFPSTQFAFTVFVLDRLSADAVRDAMQAGQFYSVVGPATMDLREAAAAAYDGAYPELRSFSIDREAAEISIDAVHYDEIVWISGSATWRYSIDPETGISWPAGEIVGRGPVFGYSDTAIPSPYVRAEVIWHSAEGPVRLMLNPVGLADP
jgi:hypothetical protein